MMTPDEILKQRGQTASADPATSRPYDPTPEAPFDCKKRYGHGPRHDFDTKEERARWGGVLSQAPQGYSGSESGTRSVIRSMKDDRWLATLDARTKRQSQADKRFHDFLVNNVFPRFVTRFNLYGRVEDYTWESVPDPCMDTREAAWIAEIAYKPYWVDATFRALVVTALRFVVQHGNFTDPCLAPQNRCIKARLVEAFHRITDKRDKHRDDWWKNMFEERKMKGEIPCPTPSTTNGSTPPKT